ncbi:MAG: FeoA domain-containing protein [Methanomicrobiaceae archaeon]|nr:FeoA domain-containing protein [Methanomicrobiaceae archaeon]
MDQSDREDYLEAVIMHSAEGRGAETLNFLSGLMDRDADQIGADLRVLEKEGDLVIEEGGSISLTEEGRSTGESVLKKHRILECFFTEMLGMDPDTASKEACEIEHAASEATVNKIGNLLSGSGVRCRGRRHGPGFVETHFPKKECRFDVIDDFSEGDILKVVGMRHGPGGGRRLIDLGIIPGEEIRIVRRLPGRSVLVSVKGSEVAISPEIAGRVVVEKLPDTDSL